MVTIIGRGHGGTRAMSHTLTQSGYFMGAKINNSGDLIPAQDMYDACRIFGNYVTYKGNCEWDFSKVLSMDPTPEFISLVNRFLKSVLESDNPLKGWKLPETVLCFPWILKMFPDIKYITWVRDPRDSILSEHVTDDLHDFNIDYDPTDDIRVKRAISWKYQREIMHATPMPKHCISVRFEDFVFDQDNQLKRIGDFLGTPLAKIEMRPDSVGRYKNDDGLHMFDFFKDEMDECGYEY
ncbi:MAG: sulfotransferase [Clostridia bacterium]|nr:sulfotransferase [Clostridia bacterium]